MRTDRRRFAGLHADGRTSGGGACLYPAPASSHRACDGLCSGGGLGWPNPRLLFRLAGEFLDYGTIWSNLFCEPLALAEVGSSDIVKAVPEALKRLTAGI